MNIERKQIKDLKVALKDMEPYVRDPQFLTQGKRFSNFNMLVREAWGNWLLCAVFSRQYNEDFTFQETEDGDGIVFGKKTKKWCVVEHVCALDFPKGKKLPKNEDRALWAINYKIKRGPNYAKDKSLVVFLDGAELWYPNRVGRQISWQHNFLSVYCVGLLVGTKEGYSYSVSELGSLHSPTWRIEINHNFTSWNIIQVQ